MYIVGYLFEMSSTIVPLMGNRMLVVNTSQRFIVLHPSGAHRIHFGVVF